MTPTFGNNKLTFLKKDKNEKSLDQKAEDMGL